jgi:protein TonB
MAEFTMNDYVLSPRRFGWPAVLAVGLHAAILIGPALDLRSSRTLPEEQPTVQVDLVESPGPLEPHAQAPATAKADPVAKQPVSVPPQPVSPPEPVATVAEAPQQPAPVAQATPAEPAPAVDAEPVAAPAFLSVSAASAPIHRPLRVAMGGPARTLRDTTAESGAIRSKARLGDNPRPEYPRSARESGWEGTVMLRVEVLENGTSGAVLVHKTCGHAVLDDAALSAVQKWKFAPAMDGAFPVRSIVYLPVQFDLRAAR